MSLKENFLDTKTHLISEIMKHNDIGWNLPTIFQSTNDTILPNLEMREMKKNGGDWIILLSKLIMLGLVPNFSRNLFAQKV